MEGEFQGVRPSSELCIFPILIFLTDIKIKHNKNIVGYIISHKNHLNRQIFCAKMCYLKFFALGLKMPPLANPRGGGALAPPCYKRFEEAWVPVQQKPKNILSPKSSTPPMSDANVGLID